MITHGVAMGAYVLSLRGVGVRPRAAAILWPPALAALVLALHWLGPWRAALPARLAIPPLYALGCLLAGVVHKTDWHALRGILTARVGGGR